MITDTDNAVRHTPGPWQVLDEHNSGASRVQAGPFEILLTNVTGAKANVWTANARLIAAAPELLAALKALIRYSDDEVSFSGMAEALRTARAAIAKADGGA